MAWVDVKTTYWTGEPPEATGPFLLDLADEVTEIDGLVIDVAIEPLLPVEAVCFEDDVTAPYTAYRAADDPTQVDRAPIRQPGS